jgi:hypothetical protein
LDQAGQRVMRQVVREKGVSECGCVLEGRGGGVSRRERETDTETEAF